MVEYTRFDRVDCPVGARAGAQDLHSLIDDLAAHSRTGRPRDEQPTWSPALFQRDRRDAANALILTALVLDLDDVPAAAWSAVLRRLRSLELAHAWHTSWSHCEDSDQVRARLIVPLPEPYDVAGRADHWARTVWPKLTAHVLGDTELADPACRDVARQYYVPVPGRAGYASAVIDGRPLDVSRVLANRSDAATVRLVGSVGRRTITRDMLRRRTRQLLSCTSEHAAAAAACLRGVLRGEAWGEDGGREGPLSAACLDVVQQWPDLDPEQVTELFEPALADIRMQDDPGAQGYTRHAVARKLREKLRVVEGIGVAHDEPPAKNACGILLLGARDVYLRRGDGSYDRYSGWGADVEIPRTIAAAGLSTVDHRGRALSAARLRRQYGEALREVRYDAIGTAEYVDGVLRLPPPLVRWPNVRSDLTPEYDDRVARWLALLGGDRESWLCDWLACATSVERECGMLWITGASGIGKTVLGDGLAALWAARQATRLDERLLAWSAPMAQCPLLMADERLPYDRDRGCVDLDRVKALVSAREHALTRKGTDAGTLVGHVRIIVTANELARLATRVHVTGDDREAMLVRIVHVPVDERRGGEIREYLAGLRARDEQWDPDAIAKHALWLREERQDRLPSGTVRLCSEHADEQPELAQLFGLGAREHRKSA